jgi:hypothetical protein
MSDPRLNRFILETLFSNSFDDSKAKDLQNDMMERAVNVVEKLLAKYDEYDVVIDKLQVEIPDERAEHWEFHLEEQLEKQIQKRIEPAGTEAHQKPDVPHKGQSTEGEILMFYLETGSLPWHAGERFRQLGPSGWAKIISELPEGERSTIARLINSLPAIRLRFFHLVKPLPHQKRWDTVQKLSQAVSGTFSADVTRILGLSSDIERVIPSELIDEWILHQIDLATAAGSGPKLKILPESIREYLKISFPGFNIEEKQGLPEQIMELEKVLSIVSTKTKDTKKEAEAIIQNWGNTLLELEEKVLNAIDGHAPGKEKGRIQVSGAGIALLAPFISTLFKALRLITKDGDFKSRNARERGILVLHYLVTLNTKYSEPGLTLFKLLCGWPVDMPLPLNRKYTKKEKKECVNLLETVIKRWSALKSTSPKGMSEAFLIRRGTLEASGSDHILRVEGRSIDILLSSIPWQYQVIKFPWNNFVIHCDWNHET